MSIDITLTDKQGNTINYDANSMLSEFTHYGYIVRNHWLDVVTLC